jgi:predicted DNA-binding transcriptional regulator AlpA
MIEREELLTSEQTGEYLGVTRKTLLRWHKQGIGPRRVQLAGSRLVRYRVRDVNAWLEEQARVAARVTTRKRSTRKSA